MPLTLTLTLIHRRLRSVARQPAARWIALTAAAIVAGCAAAWVVAPRAPAKAPAIVSMPAEAESEAAAASTAAETGDWRDERIGRGDTLPEVLARLEITDADAVHFLTRSHEARGLRRLVPGRIVSAQTAPDGRLLELRYAHGMMMTSVKPHAGGFRIEQGVAPLERRIVARSAEIRTTLFNAIDAAKLDDTIAAQLSEIYASDVDFHRQIRGGDRFSVIYEMYYAGGEPLRWGRVLAAELVTGGEAHHALWFQPSGAPGAYYTPDARPLRKAFLRSPLDYSRITSGFADARFHPILQLWRAHKGVDYAAATGTPVKATAEGVVDSAGHDRGYGNFIVVRHAESYTTLYGHLSGFVPGVTHGLRVAQGQVIGYVGSTGLATGPHLHYEFRVNRTHQDPLAVAQPPSPPISEDLKPVFDQVATRMLERLRTVRGVAVAVAH